MKVCKVRNLEIGRGKPKVCVPIVGNTKDSIFQILDQLKSMTYDFIELRIDYFDDVMDINEVIQLVKEFRQKSDKPLLFTCRSANEGGCIDINDNDYKELIQAVCKTQCIDIIDLEVMKSTTLIYELVEYAHQHHVKVLMSYHDMEKTPEMNELKAYLERMEILNGDILKIAVMPHTYKDVIDVINLTLEMSHRLTKPIVVIAMGSLGKLTRISGELTRSSITFAALEKSCAPGQLLLDNLQTVLEAIHND